MNIRLGRVMRNYGFLLVLFLYGSVIAQENSISKKDILLYEPCETLKSDNQGVKIADAIQIEDQGRYGKAYRIERPWNSVKNGDFAQKDMAPWVYRDNASWQPDGGVDNSSCIKVSAGDISLPLTGLNQNSVNAFSFYAKKSDPASESTVSVCWESGGKQNILIKDRKLGNDFERITQVLSSPSDSGTLIISVNGAALIDNAQLDRGHGFFNSFKSNIKMSYYKAIDVPVNGKYFSAAEGSFSCWIKTPWMNPEVAGNEVCTFFFANNAEQKIRKWGSTYVIGVCGIPRKNQSDKIAGTLNAYTVDAENHVVAVSNNLDVLKFDENQWHLLAVTWKLKDGKMNISMYMDGDKLKINKELPFGQCKPPVELIIGSGNGGFLNGLIDDVAIFNRPLTEAEIMTIYKSSQPLSAMLK